MRCDLWKNNTFSLFIGDGQGYFCHLYLQWKYLSVGQACVYNHI